MEAVIMALEEYANKNLDRVASEDKGKDVKVFFDHAKTNVGRILCLIRGIVTHLIDTDLTDGTVKSLKQSKYDHLNSQVKFDYWVMYREYEVLLDYSYQMLKSIVGDE
jgi:hypothetical protein